jgi:potassium efflux system protein
MLGHILQSVGAGGRFTHSLGRALSTMAPYLYFLTLTIAMCRNNGLAQAHLRWPRARRAAVLRLRTFLYAVFIPLLVLAGVCFARDLDSANGTLLRMVLVLLHLSLAAICWWLLHPERLLSARGGGRGEHQALKRALRVSLALGFLFFAALPLFGFVLTSAMLLKLSLNTLAVLLGVSLAHGLVLRWLMLGERRLALAKQAQADDPDKSDAGGANLDAPEVVQDSVDVRLASSQSRRLLRAFTVLLLGLGLAWSLAEVAPAFTLLDRVLLWHTSEMVDGIAQVRAVSLGDVTLALITLVLGVSAARNLPGLLEIMLLERFLADASMRYAIVAVTRYVITFILLVAVFGFLGLRWGHLQWLAAGFSVGLGFGLQEIFGNFVAGLILLFERPFRVGDVVTIGELTGTVRRIRTRATTITDFDNREIVIPNKTFITERFVNWTLSDTTTRITIKVGVSYDSDPALVRSTLLQLAHEHPAVLNDPPPAALFMALADSTLSFELRCFVREIGDRLRVSDDLHAQIIESFRRLGISIAYPQLDLHLHRPAAKKAGDEGMRA